MSLASVNCLWAVSSVPRSQVSDRRSSAGSLRIFFANGLVGITLSLLMAVLQFGGGGGDTGVTEADVLAVFKAAIDLPSPEHYRPVDP